MWLCVFGSDGVMKNKKNSEERDHYERESAQHK